MSTTSPFWANKQKIVWEEKLRFSPTSDHLQVWARAINEKIGLTHYLQNLTVDDLTPPWREGGKKKDGEASPPVSTATMQLKSVWRDVMDFTPKPWHLHFFQLQVEKAVGIDRYFEEVTVDHLIEIVREVASQPSQSATTASKDKTSVKGK